MTCRPLTKEEADELRAKHWPKDVTYPPIHLWTDLTYVYVSIEVNGQWIEVIREVRDCPFSHIVEPGGIAERIRLSQGKADDACACKTECAGPDTTAKRCRAEDGTL